MKVLFTLLVVCCINSMISATILTVSNNPTYPAQYSTVQSAIDAASVGDTVYIYPSNYSENLFLYKRLVIIGGGIDPRRPNRLTTYIGSGNLNIPTAAGSGSVIMGIYFGNALIIGATSPCDNTVISDCRFAGLNVQGNNTLFENNIVNSYSTFNGTGLIIQNNSFQQEISLQPGAILIRNNIFASNDANNKAIGNGPSLGPSVQIQNNIFYKNNPTNSLGSTNNCEFKNNIYYLTSAPVPTNVYSSGNINADPLFVDYPAAGANFDFNYNYHLQPASPGINYGTDGKDVGMWGGTVPINAGFEPPIPRIYELTVNNASVPPGGTIQLTIKATKAQ